MSVWSEIKSVDPFSGHFCILPELNSQHSLSAWAMLVMESVSECIGMEGVREKCLIPRSLTICSISLHCTMGKLSEAIFLTYCVMQESLL